MNFFLIVFFIFLNFYIIVNFPKISNYINLFDLPDNILKKHSNKIALLGGPLIFLNISIYLILYFIIKKIFPDLLTLDEDIQNFVIIYFFSSIFFLIGIFDDKFKIHPNIRMVLFITLIIIFLFFNESYLINNFTIFEINIYIDTIFYSFIFTIFCYLAFINAFNMFDGINLQIGTYSIFIVFILLFNKILFLSSIPLLASLFFYLYLNYFNKCFMGDSGTLFLSFLFSSYFIYGNNDLKIIDANQILSIMFFPGIDMLRLFFQRAINGLNPLRGDRHHIHHLLEKKLGNFLSALIIFFVIISGFCLFIISKNILITAMFNSLAYIVILYFGYNNKKLF